MNIEAITSAIINYITSGEEISSSRIPQKQVRDEVHTLRGRFIREMVKAGLRLPTDCYSHFKNIEFEYKAINEVCAGGDSEYEVKVANIPKLLTHPTTGKSIIRFAGNMNRSSPLRVIHGNQILYYLEEELHKDQPTIWVDPSGGRVVLLDTTEDYIQMEAVVSNPDHLIAYENCEYTEDSDYPADEEMIDKIIGKISDSYGRMFYRMQPIQRNTFRDTQGLENQI